MGCPPEAKASSAHPVPNRPRTCGGVIGGSAVRSTGSGGSGSGGDAAGRADALGPPVVGDLPAHAVVDVCGEVHARAGGNLGQQGSLVRRRLRLAHPGWVLVQPRQRELGGQVGIGQLAPNFHAIAVGLQGRSGRRWRRRGSQKQQPSAARGGGLLMGPGQPVQLPLTRCGCITASMWTWPNRGVQPPPPPCAADTLAQQSSNMARTSPSRRTCSSRACALPTEMGPGNTSTVCTASAPSSGSSATGNTEEPARGAWREGGRGHARA